MDLEQLISKAKEGQHLSEDELQLLCEHVKEILIEESDVQPVNTPVTVCGDLHGLFHSIIRKLFQTGGHVPESNYIFVGDFVDRAYNSLEGLTVLLLLKARYPANITLLRGNHDSWQLKQVCGLYDECQRKYGTANAWRCCTDLFDYLPRSAIVDGTILYVHRDLCPAYQIDQVHTGEASMERCEIMLKDLIDSVRLNTNISAGLGDRELSVYTRTSPILSVNFLTPVQDKLLLRRPIDKPQKRYISPLLGLASLRYSLPILRLELQFEDRVMQFTVAGIHAAIIKQFQETESYTSEHLVAILGIPIHSLKKGVGFWISKGVLRETTETYRASHVLTLVEPLTDSEKSERSIASVEDQLCKDMTIYEKFIMGILTNFGSMALERIHNSLKMFCAADPFYDNSVGQLHSFLSGLVSENKIDFRDGMYILNK